MKLLQPITVGKTTLKNRLMFPPLTTGYEDKNGSITPQSRAFYGRVAKGGAGYIVIGDVNPVRSISPTPRLYEDAQIESFKELADAVHVHGAKIAVQIFYPEYDVEALCDMFAKGDMQGARAKMHHDMMHFTTEVSEEKLMDIRDKIVACALRAQKAGFDAVEVHGDRLVGALCSTKMNRRTDQFGGSLENRTRFARMLVRALKEAVPDMILDYKFSVIRPDRGKGGIDEADAVQFAQWLEEDGVDMLHVAQGNHTGDLADTIPPMGVQPYGFFLDITARIKEAVKIPISTVGRIVDPKMAERVLESGIADIVALGRPLLADPDWGVKLEEGREDQIRRCLSCNKGCTDNIQNRMFLSCILNAENGCEQTRSIKPATERKKVLVVGGGIAGLEAARVAALKGHDVTLYEKGTTLGGQINLSAVPPRKDEMRRAVQDAVRLAMTAGAKLELGRAMTAEALLAEKPDAVLVAVGASCMVLNVPGADGANVCDAWSVLEGTQNAFGKVVVIGGGLVGCETAEYLAHRGCEVSIVEMLDTIASGESTTVLPTLLADFEAHKVQQYTGVTLKSITPNGVYCEKKDGETLELPCDYVVMAVGAKPVPFEIVALEKAGVKVVKIGDCEERAADICYAIRTAYDAANAL